ncbi:hypothetical protein MA16_Dca018672 [Dendrobium catenatum]|uniref:Uncharacterized protein n=1 Tax=Dendrobium catenatum TaxID=906689 RepID=A0A2I0X1E7_9ASPA|nr:hypothetical protein MA16_Dca018672 [Dendrobium catenatum]
MPPFRDTDRISTDSGPLCLPSLTLTTESQRIPAPYSSLWTQTTESPRILVPYNSLLISYKHIKASNSKNQISSEKLSAA